MAKSALKESAEGEQMQILSDNRTSYNNLISFFLDNHIKYEASEINGEFSITVSKSGHALQTRASSKFTNPEAYCTPAISNKILNDTVVVIKSRKMGDGDELLGIMLLEAYIETLTNTEKQPSTIIFYNEGVKLLTDDSPLQKTIRQLIDQGVNVIYCGTCVDYYELKDKITIGNMTNMLTISESLLKAEKVIYP